MSKDAKKVLYEMYKEYLVRRDNKVSKSQARSFGSIDNIHSCLFPDWLLDDLDETLRELHRGGYLSNIYASNTIYHCELTDQAIMVMENQKKETLLSVLDFISKFIP